MILSAEVFKEKGKKLTDADIRKISRKLGDLEIILEMYTPKQRKAIFSQCCSFCGGFSPETRDKKCTCEEGE